MQFSLPALPFDPVVAKTGAAVGTPTRAGDSASSASDANFGDLLPVDPRAALKSSATDKNSLSPVRSKKTSRCEEGSSTDDSDSTTDESDGSKTDQPQNWLIANGLVQGFAPTAAGPIHAPTVAGNGPAGQIDEGSEGDNDVGPQISDGGRAVGLTRAMPTNAQGAGRANALLMRSERKPFVVTPTPITAQNSAPASAATSPKSGTANNLDVSNELGAAGDAVVDAAKVANLERTATSTNLSGSRSSELSKDSLGNDQAATSGESAPAQVAAPAGTAVVATAGDEPQSQAAPAPVDSSTDFAPKLVDPALPQVSLSANPPVAAGSSAADDITGDSVSRAKGVPFGKVFPLVGSEKFSTAPGLANAGAKFAAGLERRRGISTTRGNGGEIKSLASDKDDVTSALFGLGINAAKNQLSMAASATTSDLPSSLTPSMTTPAVSATSALGHQLKDESQTGASVSAARRAVESAIAMAEHFAGGEHRGVNLQFSVSGVDLAVRVELRGDAVHTTFRTDSPELRAALAHEWQAVNSQSSERPIRLADPVFAANSNGSATQSDAGSSQQRESAARGQFNPEQFAGSRSMSRTAQPSTTAPAPAAVLHETISTSGRLRTFA